MKCDLSEKLLICRRAVAYLGGVAWLNMGKHPEMTLSACPRPLPCAVSSCTPCHILTVNPCSHMMNTVMDTIRQMPFIRPNVETHASRFSTMQHIEGTDRIDNHGGEKKETYRLSVNSPAVLGHCLVSSGIVSQLSCVWAPGLF